MRVFVYEYLCARGLAPGVPSSLLVEGWAMLSAVATDFERLAGVEVWTLLGAPGLPYLGHVCVRATPAEEPGRFRALAARADATLVIAPEFDDLLAARSEMVLAAGGRLLGSRPDAIRLTGDKASLARHWQACGIPTPQVVELSAETLPVPGVCKPRAGAGSQATYLVRRADEWPTVVRRATAEWPGPLIAQPFVPGQAASVALLLGPGQCVPLLPAAQRLSDDGRFRYLGGELPLPEPLAERAIHLAQRAVAGIDGLQGFVGVDLVLGAAADYAIEINPRLTTSYAGLRRLCRENLAELWLRQWRGETIPPPTWHPGVVRFNAAGTVEVV